MAGGINLPFNIGVGPVQGGMTFAPNEHDPFTTMLRAYGLGQQGIGQGIENQANQVKLPYTERIIQSDLAHKLAQGNLYNEQAKYFGPASQAEMALHSAQAEKEQMLADIMRMYMPGGGVGGSAPSGEGGNNGTNGSSGGYNGAEMGNQIFRSIMKLPGEFPSEHEARDIRTFTEKEGIKQGNIGKYGTIQHQTETQRVKQAIENLTPVIEELAVMEVPRQEMVGHWPFSIIYANEQANYKATTAVATDKILAAFQLPKNEKSQLLVENITERRPWEDVTNYRKRVNHELSNLRETYKNFTKNTGENTLRGPSVEIETLKTDANPVMDKINKGVPYDQLSEEEQNTLHAYIDSMGGQ